MSILFKKLRAQMDKKKKKKQFITITHQILKKGHTSDPPDFYYFIHVLIY